MKKTCNIFNCTLRRTAATVVIFAATLFLGSHAWADPGFGYDTADGKGISVIFSANGGADFTIFLDDNHTRAQGQDGHNFGTVQTFIIKDLYAYYWQSGDNCTPPSGQSVPGYYKICGCKLFWRIKDGEDNVVKSGNVSLTDEGGEWVSCYRNSKFKKNSLDLDLRGDLVPGTYTFEFWYEMNGQKGDGTKCDLTYTCKDVTSENPLTATFTVDRYLLTVNIADTAKVFDGPQVELSGYLKYSSCDYTLYKRGFFFCKDDGSACTPETSSMKVEIDGTSDGDSQQAKQLFTRRFVKSDYSDVPAVSNVYLTANSNYHYKAYVYSETTDSYTLSAETGAFHTGAGCTYTVADTIYYTIDNTQPEDLCGLRFQSLADAVADMKRSHHMSDGTDQVWMDNTSGNDSYRCLIYRPIVFEVAFSTYGSDNSTRDASLENINTKSISSSYATLPTTPGYRLIVRAKDAVRAKEVSGKPVFQGGLSLLGARNVTLQNLKITRDVNISEHYGSAVELGYYPGHSEANHCLPGAIQNTNIEILDCEIDATGFNCIHITGCNGVKLEDNVFDLQGSGSGPNDKHWGASVKLMGCKNVQFTRNNMRGSHSTTLWVQHTQNMLIMNNVFWNDNLFTENVAFIRPMMFGPASETPTSQKITNIAIYYNTMYLENRSTSTSSEKIDFLRFGGPSSAYSGESGGAPQYNNDQSKYCAYYDVANIHFKWNNCYSYDTHIKDRNSDDVAFLKKGDCSSRVLPDDNFRENNFWGKANSGSTNFEFGAAAKEINVEEQVCKSNADDPDELIVKTGMLNEGERPQTDISGLNVANHTFADRHNLLIRSEGGGDWTYGAFQQANPEELETIVWRGYKKNGLWDDRGNWETPSGKRVNCANVFAANLKVIIPAPEKWADASKVPTIPDWATGSEGIYSDERVAAGMRGTNLNNLSKFVDMIDIERGGAIKGIENLYKDELRYTGAVDTITVYRTEERAKNIKQTDWVLVGGVVKKFKDSSDPSQGVRDIVSGDFFVENQTPHVYMQEFTEESGNFKPTIPFTDLKTVVPTYSAFGIYIPDQYGPYKLSSEIYYTYFDNQPDKVKDCYAPVFFDFTGRFANDDKLPEYPVSTAGKWIFVNNSYPANLDIYQLVDDYSDNELDAKIYDYSDREFRDPQDGDVVKPNNGFAIKVSSLPSGNKIQTEADHFVSGSTDYLKSADASTKLTLKVINGADATASTLYVKYGARSLDKAFSHNESTPEVYVPDGENRYSTFGIGDLSEIIPLSVRNKQPSGNLTFQFRLMDSNGFESVILEDRVLEKTYDLLGGEAPFFTIAPGDCAGRFYLNINYAEEEISTNVEEKTETKENNGIDIFANGDMLTVSASPASTLESIMVFDMSGRMYSIPVNGSNYVRCKLSVASGVYTVKAVSNKATETRKVIIK